MSKAVFNISFQQTLTKSVGFRYFVHDDYAAVSAFVNVPGDDSQRNAQMLSVGVSVPLSYGRLGKGWRHAGGLQQLAEYG